MADGNVDSLFKLHEYMSNKLGVFNLIELDKKLKTFFKKNK